MDKHQSTEKNCLARDLLNICFATELCNRDWSSAVKYKRLIEVRDKVGTVQLSPVLSFDYSDCRRVGVKFGKLN